MKVHKLEDRKKNKSQKRSQIVKSVSKENLSMPLLRAKYIYYINTELKR